MIKILKDNSPISFDEYRVMMARIKEVADGRDVFKISSEQFVSSTKLQVTRSELAMVTGNEVPKSTDLSITAWVRYEDMFKPVVVAITEGDLERDTLDTICWLLNLSLSPKVIAESDEFEIYNFYLVAVEQTNDSIK